MCIRDRVFTGPGRQRIMAKLDHIRIQNFTTGEGGMPLTEVLKLLAEQCRIGDPDRLGVNFLINNNPDPVSYTHLDVYKRQAGLRVQRAIFPTFRPFRRGRSPAKRMPRRWARRYISCSRRRRRTAWVCLPNIIFPFRFKAASSPYHRDWGRWPSNWAR